MMAVPALLTGIAVGWLLAEIFHVDPRGPRRADLLEGRRLFALELLPLVRCHDWTRLSARILAESAPTSTLPPQPSQGGENAG